MKKGIAPLIVLLLLGISPHLLHSITGDIRVHFLNVGQGDCALIQTPNGKNMLIDAGYAEDVNKRIQYLVNQGIKRLDIVVCTHPHADHIGGMAQVLRTFDVGKVYLPDILTNTLIFEDLLLSIRDKALSVETAMAGKHLNIDPALDVFVLAPVGTSYGNLNDYSIVIKIVFNKISFLFMGDAGILSENEIMSSGEDLKADVLKIGHHGASDSTSEEFLKRVSPRYAIISVGQFNSYMHPDQSILHRLAVSGIEVYRTDINGTIVFKSDGRTLNDHGKRGGQPKSHSPTTLGHSLFIPYGLMPLKAGT